MIGAILDFTSLIALVGLALLCFLKGETTNGLLALATVNIILIRIKTHD